MGRRRTREEIERADMEARHEGPQNPRKKKNLKPLEAKTQAQGHYIISMESNQLTFGVGPAGTGKTYVCTRLAAEALQAGDIEKIIVTRPAVEAGGGLGFLPGTIQEKFAPYFAPFRAVLDEVFGPAAVDNMIKNGKIEIAPLEYLRGTTFKNAFVILDEAQNTTPGQMKLFLSRIGEYTTVVVNGDITQKDIEGDCGMSDAMDRLEGLDSVEIVEFDEDDIVRSGLVREIIKRYRK
jgi:phosphate starvation-inducible PhoH-like protein